MPDDCRNFGDLFSKEPFISLGKFDERPTVPGPKRSVRPQLSGTRDKSIAYGNFTVFRPCLFDPCPTQAPYAITDFESPVAPRHFAES